MLIVLVILLLIIFFGGGNWGYTRFNNNYYAGTGIGLGGVLLILLIVYLMGGLSGTGTHTLHF
jgi:hypothetical protein